jgi:hypothetical protein
MIGNIVAWFMIAMLAFGGYFEWKDGIAGRRRREVKASKRGQAWKTPMTVYRCLWIEGVGEKVRKISIGRYTLTLSPRCGSTWIPAPCLFIESEPKPQKKLLSGVDEFALIIANRS